MIEASVQEFVRSGIERVYPGKCEEIFPFASKIESDGIGILAIHDHEEEHLAFAAGTLSGVTFSSDLVRDLGMLNSNVVVGAYVLSEGQPGHWSITYAVKLRYTWVAEATASAQMIVDALSAVPVFVQRGIEILSPKYGGEPWGIPGGWWLALMDRF